MQNLSLASRSPAQAFDTNSSAATTQNSQPNGTNSSDKGQAAQQPKSLPSFARWARFVSDPTARVRSRLTREGYQFVFLLMFSLIAAIIQNVNLLVLLAGSLAAILLLQWRLCSRTIHRISVQRVLPSFIEAGKPFSAELIVKNPKRWLGAWWIIVRETIKSKRSNTRGGGESQSLLVNIERVLPNNRSVVSIECLCEHRGQYSFRRSDLSTRFPLSLMRGIHELDNEEEFLVHPAFGRLDQNWREALELPRIGEQQRRLPISGGEGEFFGLRDYRPGDPMRMIHWRSSARRNNLVVRQFERQENYEIALMLDLTEPHIQTDKTLSAQQKMERRDKSIDDVEVGLELTITMIREILRTHAGDVNFAIADGKSDEFFRISSVALLGPVLNRLATTNLSKKSQFIQVTERLLQRISPRNPLIVLSLRTREESQIDQSTGFKESSIRGKNLRWINLSQKDYEPYFEQVDEDEV